MTLYISRDLRSIEIPWLSRANAPHIIYSVFQGDSVAVPVYRLTPLLYAALERQTDALDNLYLAGRITPDQIATAGRRLARIRTHSNENLDREAIQSAREALIARQEPLAWVLSQYVERMGGQEIVNELEVSAQHNPFVVVAQPNAAQTNSNAQVAQRSA